MNKFDELKPFLLNEVNEITKPSPKAGKNMFECPLCGSGTGPSGTGAFSLFQGNTQWKCHGCGESGDIVDLYQKYHAVDRVTAFKALSQKYMFSEPVSPVVEGVVTSNTSDKAEKMRNSPLAINVPAAMAYLEGRGISRKTVERFDIHAGYVFNNGRKVDSLLFFSRGFEGSVFCRQYEAPLEGEKPYKGNYGPKVPFNFDAVNETQQPVFVVEGEIDALSLEEIGCKSVALSSAGQYMRFVNKLVDCGAKPQLVLMLDNDEVGEKFEGELHNALMSEGVVAIRLNRGEWGYEAHDPNDWLKDNRESFEGLLELTSDKFEEIAERQAIQNEPMVDYEDGYMDSLVENEEENESEVFDFISLGEELDDINAARSAHSERISTGLDSVDKLLKGGLKETGLYLLGARSALGKSALSQQIADYIAKTRPVLYYSFEMSKEELITRSYTRIAKSKIVGVTLDSSQIESRLTKDPNDPFLGAVKELYKESAKNFYCRELDWPTVEMITVEVKAFKKRFGQAPVVFVDYLQLIQTDQKTNDTNTKLSIVSRALKLLSNECPVFVISSINRAAYYDVPSLDSFKGCGDIEYSANVAMMLTPEEFRYDIDKYQQANKALWDSLVSEPNKNLTLTVVKGRDIPLGRTFLYNAGESFLFDDIPEDAYEELLETKKDLDHKTQQTARYKGKDKVRKPTQDELAAEFEAMMS